MHMSLRSPLWPRRHWPRPRWTVALVPGGVALSGVLLAVVMLRYPRVIVAGYPPVATAAGLLLGFFLVALVVLWADTRRRDDARSAARGFGIAAGLFAGALWVAEIAFNNITGASAATRFVVDDSVWAVVALVILVVSFRAARGGTFRGGISAGLWSGTVSGVIACLAALSLVVFFMRALTADPLNIAEYASRGPDGAASIAAYFAWETAAGGLGHLVVLGTAMGLVLGLIGGAAAMAVRRLARA